MTRRSHICMSVKGALRNNAHLFKGRRRHEDSGCTLNGEPLSWEQYEKALLIERNKGRDVIPMDPACANPCSRANLGCKGFRYTADEMGGHGCPGYEIDEALAKGGQP